VDVPLKGYARYTYKKIDLTGIPTVTVFLVFSLITKVSNFVKIPIQTCMYWIFFQILLLH